MNQEQRNYLIKRIESIRKSKFNAIDEAYPVSDKLPDKTKYELITTGKVVPTVKTELNQWGSLCMGIDVDFKKYQAEHNTKLAKVIVQRNLVRTTVNAKAQELTDSIMLGDSDEAVALIAKFEAFKV